MKKPLSSSASGSARHERPGSSDAANTPQGQTLAVLRQPERALRVELLPRARVRCADRPDPHAMTFRSGFLEARGARRVCPSLGLEMNLG